MMDEKMQKVKKTGEVFTPLHIVNNILDLIGYKGKQILDKHIIDNSAGVGAFLNEIVSRYIYIAQSNNMKIQDIKENLEKYIHGIELNKDNFGNLIQNLDSIINEEGIKNVKWDVLNCDALTVTKFNNKMDYVVGNPPYVRVHNLSENYNLVKSFDFSQVGMTDLFIVFFEVGFKMLNVTGKMSYISPTS
ncbi:MAG: SAM-dependent methyltransferase [Rickettsiales bacterium]|jgi:adenine-specific DNA-methyltransferase|nr:SAM-dependent methyltransferase [Rickettsiales bacterium]